VVKGTFGRHVYDMNMNILQAVALLFFNMNKTASCVELQEHMRIELPTCKRLLHSLAYGKYRVLEKSGNSKNIHTTEDTFSARTGFSSKFKRISLHAPMINCNLRENVDADVRQHRGYSIDAMYVQCVVRASSLCYHPGI